MGRHQLNGSYEVDRTSGTGRLAYLARPPTQYSCNIVCGEPFKLKAVDQRLFQCIPEHNRWWLLERLMVGKKHPHAQEEARPKGRRGEQEDAWAHPFL